MKSLADDLSVRFTGKKVRKHENVSTVPVTAGKYRYKKTWAICCICVFKNQQDSQNFLKNKTRSNRLRAYGSDYR
ncbi:hypothetical protein C7T94_07475 [Pedobacter yulinensis]|uniref:Uncharacterized protein n=1 Tax=Pedobacter yulinensis TaxID=2126353 RepID=A0A2T3HJ82_9SPHI|nr:hypothetical protein C7T94_07475 [Pedobacter yulinensis]